MKEKLEDLIKQNLPDEPIRRLFRGKLKTMLKTKIGKVTPGFTKQFYSTPMDMVETDSAYYFDTREPLTHLAKLNIIISPIFLLLVGLILAIKKIWVTNTDVDNMWEVIEGEIPAGEYYSFVKLINEKNQGRTSHVSGHPLPTLTSSLNVTQVFVFRFKPID